MKKVLLIMSVMGSCLAFSQVGIHTSEPAASFDIAAKNPTGITRNIDGLLIPRVDRERAQSMVGVPASTLIYVNSVTTGKQVDTAADIDVIGYYYFDGILSKWVKLNPKSPIGAPNINIYNADGTLAANRILTQDDKTLAFTGTAVNAFSVDGSTLSVDAANHRIGVGTSAPGYKLDLGNSAGGTTSDVNGKLLAVYNGGGVFYGFGISPYTLQFHAGSSPTGEPPMVLTGNRLGIGTTAPQPSSILEMSSTTSGALIPRMTNAQRDAIANKAEGLMIYNMEVHCLQVWNATQWISTCASSAATITNCAAAPAGTYKEGTAMNSSNTLAITVNVTQVGDWVASSDAVNGIAWSGSGSFTNLGSQTVNLTASGTPAAAGNFNYTFTIGSSTCARSITFNPAGKIAALNCSTAINSGTLENDKAASGVSSVISYTGGDGGTHSGQVVTSTGVTGLTATLAAGTFANGNGTLTYTITGTPSSVGTASFAINIGGVQCILTRSVLCATLGIPDFPGTYVIGGNSVSATVTTSQTSTGSGIGQCNISTGGNPWYIGSNNTLSTTTFTFSRPILNMEFAINAMALGEVVTVTAKDQNGTTFNPTLTDLGAGCPGSVTITGNQITPSSNAPAVLFRATGGVYYKSITIQHNGAQAGAIMGARLCNAVSQ